MRGDTNKMIVRAFTATTTPAGETVIRVAWDSQDAIMLDENTSTRDRSESYTLERTVNPAGVMRCVRTDEATISCATLFDRL